MTPRRLPALALLLVAAACGKSRQERELDSVGRVCTSQVGSRFEDADAQMLRQGPFARIIPGCDPRLAPLPRNDTCPASSPENAPCQAFYYWSTTDPGLCSPQGGCVFKCELRFMQNDPAAVESGTAKDAAVCASRWLEGQFYP